MAEDFQKNFEVEEQRPLMCESSCTSSDSDDDTGSSQGKDSTEKYVSLMRHTLRQKVLLPRSKPIIENSDNLDTRPLKHGNRQRPLKRGNRQRRQLERFQAVQLVAHQYIFEIPADRVVYI